MQSIGSQAAKLVNTLENSTSQTTRPTESSANSPSISGEKTLRDPSKRTGTALAAAGLHARPLPSLPAALAASKPEETDRALEASLPPSVKTSKREIWEDRGTAEHGWDGAITAIEWTKDLPEADRLKALQMVDHSLTPITGAECQKALAKLRYMTKVRNESTEDIRLTLMFYAEELAKFPGDVVRYVLDTQKNISPWWPAWSELKERLDLYTAKRRRLRDALTSARRSQNTSQDRRQFVDRPTALGVDPATMAQAQKIVAERAARKRESEQMTEPTPEEFAEMKRKFIAECESA